jgi:hypothetical protein
MWEMSGAYRVLVGRPPGESLLGRPRSRWEDNIKACLKEVEWGVWIRLVCLRIGTGGRLMGM